MTALMWVLSINVCLVCAYFPHAWIAGAIVCALYVFTAPSMRRYRRRDKIFLTILYVLAWPFFLPFVVCEYLKQRRSIARLEPSEPFKLEL